MIKYFENIIQISAGGFHSLILNDQGNVFSFGFNYVFQISKLVWTTWYQ
jgi:alpha-tubulin suppressor-like RCC1 family protein